MAAPLRIRCRHKQASRRGQNGVALLLVLFIAIALGLAFLFRPGETYLSNLAREKTTEDSQTQGKEALIGFAATYRDTHPAQVFGYLPCPDTDNDGAAEATCGNQDESVIGRLPWKILGIAPLRDSANECLWYAVSGHAKDSPDTTTFNWDTLGQFIVQDADGATLAGATPHDRPFAVLLAARSPVNGQARASAGASECGGSNTATDYLEGLGALGTGDTTLVVASANSQRNGTNNDRALWITSKEIFDRVKVRSDFKNDIDTLLNDLVACLNSNPIVTASATNKGIDNLFTTCPVTQASKLEFKDNWKDNLLYAGGPSGNFTVNGGTTTCKGILIFGGERTSGQSRATVLEKNTAAYYLEGTNATLFPNNGAYTGATNFYASGTSSASTDIVRCITGLPSGATQVSFAQDLPSFTTAGATGTVSTDTTDNTVTIVDNATGTAAGCFWSPIPIPLAGKTLRAYYEYQFAFTDTFATSGAAAGRGNGFTLQLVRGDIPNTLGVFTQPNTCGIESNMGALATTDSWGSLSYIIETDVHQDAAKSDPSGNHTAIMINGSVDHSGSGGTPTSTCDGTTNGCLHSPANTFEDSPMPLAHNQRVEIHTGCNSTCTQCNPKSTGSYAKISTWVDCTDCNDVVSDLLDAELIVAQANRDFSAPGDWSGTNWFIAANALNHVAGATPASLPNSALTSPPSTGNSYVIDFTLNTLTTGTISMGFGGVSVPLTPNVGTTTYALEISASASTPLTLSPDATWTGSITAISAKPVRPPQMNRCVSLYPEMNQVFFGLTGGFLSAPATEQGVTIRNLLLRTD